MTDSIATTRTVETPARPQFDAERLHRRPVTEREVLMVAPTMFFADYGCHVRIYEEATALRSLGHDIRILAYPNGRDINGLDVRRCPGVPFNYRVVVGSSRHKIYLDAMLGMTALHEVFVRRPDVLHAHLHEGALLGRVLGVLRDVPLVFDFQGSLTGEMCDHGFLDCDGPFYKPVRMLEQWINHQPDIILTSSHHAADLLINSFEVPADRIVPVPDCVSTQRFRPRADEDEDELAGIRQQYGIPEDRTLVVYLGLLAEYQGTGLLLHAARQIVDRRPDVHFLIMGYPAVDYYRAMANDLGLNRWVTFTGRLPYEDAPTYLRLGDIAVAPKLSATEGSGKILNYMATGLPTVAFDTHVSREYLGDWGLYAEKHDAAGFANALFAALDNRHEWPILSRALRRRVQEDFSWEEAARVISQVYDSAIG